MQTIINEYRALFWRFIADISAKHHMDCRLLFILRKPFIEYSQPLTATASRHDYFMTTRYFPLCYFQLMFTETLLRETDETAC